MLHRGVAPGTAFQVGPQRAAPVVRQTGRLRADPSSSLAQTLERRRELLEVEEGTRPQSRVSPSPKLPLLDGAPIRDASKLKDGELPRVALVGRPNVGKSALLNRLTQSSKAIVYDKPGITRDRLLVRAFWLRFEFMLMDTGGLPDTKVVQGETVAAEEISPEEQIAFGVEKQVAAAVDEADLIVFVVDGREGPVDGDAEILAWLRKQHSTKPIVMAVNKCENARTAEYKASLFWELGMEPFPVSAVSGLGTGELLDAMVSKLPAMHRQKPAEEVTSIAIVGRPNTGKSSLLNAMLGEERSIVSAVPGTTRDAVDCHATLVTGERVRIVDTAGIRRRTAVYASKEKVEGLMVDRSVKALEQCHIAVLMIDCYEGIRHQDAQIVTMAKEQGCGLVVVANKFDLLNQNDWDKSTAKAIVRQQLRGENWANVVVTSLKEELPLKAISAAILMADAHHSQRLSTATVNMIVQEGVHFRPPPSARSGKKGRVYYATQVAVRPPTFVLFVNDAALFDESYRKFVEKHLRENIDLRGTPVKVLFKGKPKRDVKNR